MTNNRSNEKTKKKAKAGQGTGSSTGAKITKKVVCWFFMVLIILFVAFIALLTWVLHVQRTLTFDLPADQNVHNNAAANIGVWMVDNQLYISSRGKSYCVSLQKGSPPKKLSKPYAGGMATDDYSMFHADKVSVLRRKDGKRVFYKGDISSERLVCNYLYFITSSYGVGSLHRYHLKDGTTQLLVEGVLDYVTHGERLLYQTEDRALMLMDMDTGWTKQIDRMDRDWNSRYFLNGDAVYFAKSDGIYTLNLLDGSYMQVLGKAAEGMRLQNLYDGKLYLSTNQPIKSGNKYIDRTLYRVQKYNLATGEWSDFIEMPLDNVKWPYLTILREGAYILQLDHITQIVVDGQQHRFG